MENQVSETIRSMSMEQAKDISRVIRHYKNGDRESAYAVMDRMDADTLDLLIAYIEAVQTERMGCEQHG